MISRFGEERTILYGVCLAILSLLTITQITSNIWLLIGFLPIIAISAVVAPSIQGLVSEQTNQNEQGELQGIYTSIVAIATIISPLLMTNVFYFFTTESTPYYLPSAPFVMAAFLASLALLILQLTGSSRKPQKVGSKN
jgi:DHA1 family tetracycline resistance protein-like MFS transporter